MVEDMNSMYTPLESNPIPVLLSYPDQRLDSEGAPHIDVPDDLKTVLDIGWLLVLCHF